MKRFDVLERDGFRCLYCGYTSMEDGAELEVDHVVPVALKGKNVASNMATACWKCNREKGVRTLGESERVLGVVADRNLESGTEQGERYYPNRKPMVEPISNIQKLRNKMLLRSLTYYKKMGWR